MKYVIIFIIVVIVAGLGIGFYVIKNSPQVPESSPDTDTPTGLGADIIEKQQQEVVEDIPDANPFTNQSNPISDVYKNPFE